MRKSILAAIAALSLIMVPAIAPADPLRRDDLAKLLIGLATVAVIGAAIHEQDATPQQTRNWRDLRGGQGWADLQRPDPRMRRPPLPAACLRHLQTRHGYQALYPGRCLRRHAQALTALPDHCAMRYRTRDGARRGYDADCLRNSGYRRGRAD